MKKSIIALIALLIISLPAFSIFDENDPSVRARGMAGTYNAVSDNYEGVFYNPAGLALAQNSAGASVANLYSNSFLKLTTMGVNYNTPKFGSFAFGFEELSVEYLDVNLTSEKTFTIAHAVCLNKDVNSETYLGYSANLYNLTYEGLGSQSALGFNAGIIATLHTRTKLSLTVENINNPKMGENNEHNLPQRFTAGIAYVPYQGVTTAFDIKKNWNGDSEFHGGVEAEIFPMLTLRAGIRNNPVKYSVGLGLKPYLGVNFDYAYDYHSVLNPTHQLGLSYKF